MTDIAVEETRLVSAKVLTLEVDLTTMNSEYRFEVYRIEGFVEVRMTSTNPSVTIGDEQVRLLSQDRQVTSFLLRETFRLAEFAKQGFLVEMASALERMLYDHLHYFPLDIIGEDSNEWWTTSDVLDVNVQLVRKYQSKRVSH